MTENSKSFYFAYAKDLYIALLNNRDVDRDKALEEVIEIAERLYRASEGENNPEPPAEKFIPDTKKVEEKTKKSPTKEQPEIEAAKSYNEFNKSSKTPPSWDLFWKSVANRGFGQTDRDSMNEYIKQKARTRKISFTDMMVECAANFDMFISAWQEWAENK